jgi:hypothetical protein
MYLEIVSETEKHIIKTEMDMAEAGRAINRQWSVGWLLQMNGADRERGKQDYILNMDRLVSLMDTDRVGQNRRANKMYGWGGEQGDMRLFEIWLHVRMSVQDSLEKESKR